MNSAITTVAALFVLSAVIAVTGSAEADDIENFVTRQGDQLLVDGRPYRFISFNIPNLLVVEDAFSFTKPNPWRWPDEYEIEDALESVRQMGGQVVRTYVISVFREGADMGRTVHVYGPGEFNEEGFKTLDKVLEIARRKGIRLIIPFYDRAPWMGGQPQYAAFRGKKSNAFWTDPEIIADFKQTIEHVVNRKNTITGVAYKDDPTIFGWETGNEIDATPEWTHEIAAYVKQLDPKHLVVDGRSLRGVSQWQVDEPNTDVITTHHYPWGENTDFVEPIRAAHAKTKGKKPYFVGEFGFVPTEHIREVYDAVIEDGINGALIWSLRFHRREGGFYWHMEVGTGGNFYKAYHWPGFDSGKLYDEREVLTLTRDKAFEIVGQTPPPLKAPQPPKLLPIDAPAAISWQGPAGAASYDVERATSAEGPWSVVGQNVSDADVQYRPLFVDASVEPGHSYLYRVVARNSAGDSPPSNVVGPVAASVRRLVDECADESLLFVSEGNVSISEENARRMQEDCFRFGLASGAAIVYRVDAPIRGWRVFTFAERDELELEVFASVDGEVFTPLEAERESFAAGRGEYGYFVPVLFRGTSADGESRYLKIARPARVEAGEAAQLEISRVEIDYGGE
jgi:hypothetical protein